MWKGTAAPQRKLKHAKRNIQIINNKSNITTNKDPGQPNASPLKNTQKRNRQKNIKKKSQICY